MIGLGMIGLLGGILLLILAGYGRACWSLDLFHPDQLSRLMREDQKEFPIIGNTVKNSIPFLMDWWHFHQWIMRQGLIWGSAAAMLGAWNMFGHFGLLAALLFAGAVEGISFKLYFHNILPQNENAIPWKPLKHLLIPYST